MPAENTEKSEGKNEDSSDINFDELESFSLPDAEPMGLHENENENENETENENKNEDIKEEIKDVPMGEEVKEDILKEPTIEDPIFEEPILENPILEEIIPSETTQEIA